MTDTERAELIAAVRAATLEEVAQKVALDWHGIHTYDQMAARIRALTPLLPGRVVLTREEAKQVFNAMHQVLSDWLNDSPRGINEDGLSEALAILERKR